MKSITIRLPDLEAAMLVEVQKKNKAFKDLQQLLIQQIRQEYRKVFVWRCVKEDVFCSINLSVTRDYLACFDRG